MRYGNALRLKPNASYAGYFIYFQIPDHPLTYPPTHSLTPPLPMHLTWLDSNSWLIELGGQRILLDPWLVGPLTFGNLDWFFKTDRPQPRPIPDNVDLILLSQGLPDHAHVPTLEQLDRTIPVIASPNAAKVVQPLDYQQITTLHHGETIELNHRLSIQATPGSPVGPTSLENGYVLRELPTGASLYYEPHGFHAPVLKQMGTVDVVLTPVMNIELPFGIPVIQGSKTAMDVVRWLQPQFIIPTAAGGDVEMSGWLVSVLKATGSGAELQAQLTANQLPTQVLEPKPGDRVEIPLREKVGQ